MGAFMVLPQPQLIGLQVASAASSWGYGSWVELQRTTEAVSILGISYQWTSIPTADTTESHLIEVGTGAAGAESAQLQVSSNHRSDTAVGYYLQTFQMFFPEPRSISAGTRVSIRAADSSSSARTYQAVRLIIDRITPAGPQSFGKQLNQAVNRSLYI
jgi:hypothetical protein